MAEEKLENKPKRNYEKKERTTRTTKTTRRTNQEGEKNARATRPYHRRTSSINAKNEK